MHFERNLSHLFPFSGPHSLPLFLPSAELAVYNVWPAAGFLTVPFILLLNLDLTLCFKPMGTSFSDCTPT